MSEHVGRFAGRAADYARFRPGYPPELVDVLAEDGGLRPEHVIADVGSGTGLLARVFLDRGNRVFGVEPDDAMRRIAEETLGGRSGYCSVAGSAEATTLPDRCADWAVAGQAFHWFDREAAREELRRVLRQPRPMAVIWYTRDPGRTPFMEALEALLLEHGTDYGRVRHDRRQEEALEGFFRGEVRSRILPHAQVLDREGLRGRLRSMSYLPAPGEDGHDEVMAAADALHEAHGEGGEVRIEYDLEVHLGRV